MSGPTFCMQCAQRHTYTMHNPAPHPCSFTVWPYSKRSNVSMKERERVNCKDVNISQFKMFRNEIGFEHLKETVVMLENIKDLNTSFSTGCYVRLDSLLVPSGPNLKALPGS